MICDNKAKKEIGTMYYVPDGTKNADIMNAKNVGIDFSHYR